MSWKLIKDFFFSQVTFFFAVIVCLYLSKNPLFKEFILLLNMYKLIFNSYLILDSKILAPSLMTRIFYVWHPLYEFIPTVQFCFFVRDTACLEMFESDPNTSHVFSQQLWHTKCQNIRVFLEKYLLCKMFKKYLQLTTLLASV